MTSMKNLSVQGAAGGDPRNLIDEFKGLTNAEVKARLAAHRAPLEVAIENISHDFNAGSIVRTANNFNVRCVHIIGRRKYNRRGAMCTDKYLEVKYWPTVQEFYSDQKARGQELVAIENHTPKVEPLSKKIMKPNTTLIFGSESDGISPELLGVSDAVCEIESFGSTRSVNVGVAAGIAMYAWALQNLLKDQ